MVVIATPLAFGLLLIGLAVPRTIAAWSSLQAELALSKLQAGQSPTADELALAKDGLKLALWWAPSNRRLVTLGALELSEAQSRPTEDPERSALLCAAEGHLVAGLSRNPVDGIAWYHLATVRMLKGDGGRHVAAALVESIHMAPDRRDLRMPRASLLLRYWRFLQEAELQDFRAQLRTISSASPGDRSRLFDVALSLGELRFAAAAVGDDPLAAEAFAQLVTELDPRATEPRTPEPASRPR